eukprot:SAG31_NODE_9_length_42330_cov_441.979162_13_plen_100_part_00
MDGPENIVARARQFSGNQVGCVVARAHRQEGGAKMRGAVGSFQIRRGSNSGGGGGRPGQYFGKAVTAAVSRTGHVLVPVGTYVPVPVRPYNQCTAEIVY